MQLWFASCLRDGIALAASGGFATFREIATANVKALLAQHSSTSNADEAAESVLKGFEEVMPHDDVLPGIEQLTQGGFKASRCCFVTRLLVCRYRVLIRDHQLQTL